MHRTYHTNREWNRYKEVRVPWIQYDRFRLTECKRVLDLHQLFQGLDHPVQRREFKLSRLTVLLLFKILFGIGYRGIASAVKDLHIYQLLGMKRAPCYKTIQNTLQYLTEDVLRKINRVFIPRRTRVAGLDSSGMKTHRRGAWVVLRFRHRYQKRDFKKVHLFVDLISKKILWCTLTPGTSSDSTQVKQLLQGCQWIRIDIILGDGGYDTRNCFQDITQQGAVPGIPVRKNATTKSRGCPSRRRAVRAQQKNYEEWKKQVDYRMRCVIESIFSGMKRRFGEYFFSLRERYRQVEMWLRSILWNVLIYPR